MIRCNLLSPASIIVHDMRHSKSFTGLLRCIADAGGWEVEIRELGEYMPDADGIVTYRPIGEAVGSITPKRYVDSGGPQV